MGSSENNEFTSTLNNIGLIYFNLGHYKKALEYYLKCLTLQNKLKSPRIEISLTYNNIGLVYLSLGNYKEALNYC